MLKPKSLEKINRPSTKFLASEDPNSTYSLIIEEAKKIIGAVSGSVWIRRRSKFACAYASEDWIYHTRPTVGGVLDRVYKTRNTEVINVDNPKVLPAEIADRKIESVILVPLSYAKKSIGVLNLNLRTSSKVTDRERELLKLFGIMASLSIREARLKIQRSEAVHLKNEYMSLENILERMNRSVLKLLEPLNIQETYACIVQEAVRLVGGEEGDIFLGTATNLQRVYSSMVNPPADLARPRKRGITYKVFTKKKALVVRIADSNQKRYPSITNRGLKSTIFIPLSNRSKSIGVLVVRSFNDQEFTDKELYVLKLFGSLASLAIRKTQLYDEVNQALETRDYFISMAAHELRTPLTSVNGYAQLLERRLGSSDTTEGKWIRELASELKRLTSLVSELLTINLIKTGGLNFHWREVDLLQVVERVQKNFQFTHPERSLVVENKVSNKGRLIVADHDKMVQVLGNLVENAAKFSPPDSSIKLSLGERKEEITIEVIDQGKGIPRKDRSKIFEGFYKGSNSNQEEGMGLGLYLAKYIVTSHHGEISVNPYTSKGTKIDIVLPKIRHE